MGMRLAGALALVLGVVAFAGPAFAGNGNGNGNGNNGKAEGNAAAAAPGNSADAPGQLKKDDAASTEAPAATSTTTTTVAASTGSSPASNQGVKPSNDTAHDTHAAASSTKTKLYGNGRTAGQIAIRNGASPSTVLHGPGNSQPHKASPCSGGHEVDVHALKSPRHRGSCGSTPTPGHPGHDGGHSAPDGGSDPGTLPSTSGTTTVMAPTATKTVSRPKATPSSSPSGASGAALAAVQRPARATLPFTGFPLWIGVAAGIALLGLGLALALFAGRETEREVGP
jgi:hypothetical protein